MSLLRGTARPVLAATFVVDGLDAITRPARHVEKLHQVTPVLETAGLPPLPTSEAVLLTRAMGVVSVAAGLGLATGTAPRASAAVLAALSVPMTLVNNPVWTASETEERTEMVSRLVRGVSLGAGLLLV